MQPIANELLDLTIAYAFPTDTEHCCDVERFQSQTIVCSVQLLHTKTLSMKIIRPKLHFTFKNF